MFWFSLQICLKNFTFLEEFSEIPSQMYFCLHVKYQLLLSYFNSTWIFSTYFRKSFKYQLSWKSVQCEQRCSTRTDGGTERQTKRHYENNSRFSLFCDHAYNGYWASLHNLNICESVLTKAYGFELQCGVIEETAPRRFTTDHMLITVRVIRRLDL